MLKAWEETKSSGIDEYVMAELQKLCNASIWKQLRADFLFWIDVYNLVDDLLAQFIIDLQTLSQRRGVQTTIAV